MPHHALSFAPDLLVRSRIDLAARHYGVETVYVASEEEFRKALSRRQDYHLILVDLDRDGADTVALVREARAVATQARIIGFCSHVMTDLIRDARRAGADLVQPNSTFMAGIPGLFAAVGT